MWHKDAIPPGVPPLEPDFPMPDGYAVDDWGNLDAGLGVVGARAYTGRPKGGPPMAKSTSSYDASTSDVPNAGTLEPASSVGSSSNPTATPDGDSAPKTPDTIPTPGVSVQGGKVTITNFHHYHASVGVGTDEKGESTTKFGPGHAKVLSFEVHDHAHRLKLASLLEGVARQLRG